MGVSNAAGGQTVADQHAAADAAERAHVAEHPFVKAVLATFPGAKIESVRRPKIEESLGEAVETPTDAAPDSDDES